MRIVLFAALTLFALGTMAQDADGVCGTVSAEIDTVSAETVTASAETVTARAENVMVTAHSVDSAEADTSQLCGTEVRPKRRDIITRLLDYINDTNKNTKGRKFDFSIIGGPHYATDTGWSLGLVAAALYNPPQDSLPCPSNASLYSDISTTGYFLLGIRGVHLFPKDRQRIDYSIYFYTFPGAIWGLGYENADRGDNRTDFKRCQARLRAAWLFRLSRGFYVGPNLIYDLVDAKEPSRPELLEGQPLNLHNFGLGVTLVYDTRDVLTNPHRGMYANVSQYFRPRFLDNKFAFSTTELELSGYRRAWRGAILAANLRSTINLGNPSWAMMAGLGTPGSMRGYYEGRYRDKSKWEAQVELRQHVWHRNGFVVWAGAGQVFARVRDMRFDRILPNYGLGYRWEFKKDVNVRLDYGFGKRGQKGFLFNINEAF